ncbi:MAG: hypothetical protein HGB26_07770 [Desulfobulbaceae bacterium]|nr:hypothetical protein [Desulfobulbaceae bacterium]
MARFIEAGNVVNFDRQNCLAYGSGRISLGASFGQVKLETFGSVANNLVDGSSSFVLTMLMDLSTRITSLKTD